MNSALDFILHLDKHLAGLVQHLGPIWSYLILFLVLFAETGLVIAPFLPGDSLLFVTGALLAKGGIPLTLPVVFIVFCLGAIVGDTVNFEVGQHWGRRLFQRKTRFLNPDNLERTEKFFAKHGRKTIILGRFVPIVRTFAPFVAGMSKMPYRQFITYNVVGGVLWVSLFLFGGYFFGNLPLVRDNFIIVVAIIMFFSFLPVAYEFLKARQEKNEKKRNKLNKTDQVTI